MRRILPYLSEMATVTVDSIELPGALGPILVDLRTTTPGTAQPTVLIHHGFKGFKDWALLPIFADRLARAGFNAVTLSVSGAGVDAEGNFNHLDRFAVNTYSRELDDLAVVTRALLHGEVGAPPSTLGMLGHSRGGGMVLCLTRQFPEIIAVATWAAIARARRHDDEALRLWKERGRIEVLHARLRIKLPLDFVVAEDCLAHETGRLDIPRAAALLGRPLLLAHGRADETVPFSEAESLLAAANSPLVEALFIEDAGHTFGTTHPWTGPTSHSELLFGATTRFFIRHLA
jgi:pimeloyl-ACP methyl ester carboxylesterase